MVTTDTEGGEAHGSTVISVVTLNTLQWSWVHVEVVVHKVLRSAICCSAEQVASWSEPELGVKGVVGVVVAVTPAWMGGGNQSLGRDT